MRDPRIDGIPEPADAGFGSPSNDAAPGPEVAPPGLVPDPEAPAVAADPGTDEAAGADAEVLEPEAGAADVDVDVDVEALIAKAAKADEYLDLAQRTRAEFDNFRKRTARDAAVAKERGAMKLALELLPAIDNLDRALAHAAAGGAENGDGSLVAGIKHVHSDLIAALKRAEIEPYSPEGEPFDPQYHEAVAQQPFEGTAPGTVVEVYQRGYRRGESVLRPARVVVAG